MSGHSSSPSPVPSGWVRTQYPWGLSHARRHPQALGQSQSQSASEASNLYKNFHTCQLQKNQRVKSLGDAVDRGVCGGASPFTLGTSLKIYDAAYAYRSWLGQWMWWRAQQKHARRWKIVAFSFWKQTGTDRADDVVGVCGAAMSPQTLTYIYFYYLRWLSQPVPSPVPAHPQPPRSRLGPYLKLFIFNSLNRLTGSSGRVSDCTEKNACYYFIYL